MGADAIGIAYRIESEIVGVQPDGPAASAELLPGDTILKAKIIYTPAKDGDTPEPLEIELGRDKPYWPTVFDAMQFVPDGTVVELTVARGNEGEPRQIQLAPVPARHAFIAARGLWFKPFERIRMSDSLAEQVRYGWDETAESLTMVFRFLKKLGTQVPLTALGGPVTIAKAAGYSAAEGLSSLLIFLTMLSANLAVINFMPIPLLDGGHMVFLAYEWVRGRPANERFVVALHTAGFVFIVTLMLYVLALDFNLIDRNL
jgi:regulator of sigma E protease